MSLRGLDIKSVTQTLQDVKTEILTHLDVYGGFLANRDVCRELEAYCEDGNYATDTVDLVIYALATIHGTMCCVVHVSEQGTLSHRLISPVRSNSRKDSRIAVLYIKEFEHYEALKRLPGKSSPLNYWVPPDSDSDSRATSSRYVSIQVRV